MSRRKAPVLDAELLGLVDEQQQQQQAPVAAAVPKTKKQVVDGESEKKKKKKKKKKPALADADGVRLTKTMNRVYKLIKNTGEGVPVKKRVPLAHSTFARRFREEAKNQRTRLALGERRLTYKRGVTRRAEFVCKNRLTMLATIAARVLEEVGLKKCSIGILHMARDIYNFCRFGTPLRLKYMDCARLKYRAKFLKYRASRQAKAGEAGEEAAAPAS
jgi:hypothetical protein